MKKTTKIVLITIMTLFMSFTTITNVNAEEISQEETIILNEETEVENLETTTTEIVSGENTEINPETSEMEEGALQDGEVDIDKDAEIIPNPEDTPSTEGDSREAEITFEIESETFTTNGGSVNIDVALVIDASGSMDNHNSYTTITNANGEEERVTRLEVAKRAAVDFVNKLYAAEGLNFKISLVKFSNSATIVLQLTAKTSINDENEYEVVENINDITTYSKTNVQDGIEKGASTLGTDNKNVMIVLSDGAANKSNVNNTQYNSVKNILYVAGSTDNKIGQQCYNNMSRCNDDEWTIITAEYYRQTKQVDIYTIGFKTTEQDNITLKRIAGDDKRFIGADDGDTLLTAFMSLIEKIQNDVVATDVILTDIIPEEFDIKETVEEIASKNNIDADKITITKNEKSETSISYNIGNLLSTKDVNFKYVVVAKDTYHGSIYTNTNAILTGIKADGNPFRFTSESINSEGKVIFTLDTINPSVVVPAITSDDHVGSVKENDELEILNSTITNNDKTDNVKIDNAISIEDKVVIVSGPTNGTLLKNSLGTGYIYTPTNYSATSDSYMYKIVTTIKYSDGSTKVVNSNISTVTLEILQIVGDLVLVYNYVDENGEVIKTLETNTSNKNLEYNKLINASTYQKPFVGYKFLNVTPSSLKIGEGRNTIVYKYVKDETQTKTINYYVNYYKDGSVVESDSYEKSSTVWINDPDTILISPSINVANNKYLGYTLSHTSPITIPTSAKDNDTINIYYVKDNFDYVVEYYKDSITESNKMHTSLAFSEVYETVLTEEIIATDLGENWINAKKPVGYENGMVQEYIKISTSGNVIQVLYVKDNFDYVVEYYKDSITESNKMHTSLAFSEVYETVLTEEIIATDLGENWINAKKPVGYENGAVQEYIKISTTGNVIQVLYVKDLTDTKTITYVIKHHLEGTDGYEYQLTDDYSDSLELWIGDSANSLSTDDYELKKYGGYVLNLTLSDEITDLVENGTVINLYYDLKTDLSYAINYLDKETMENIHEAKISQATFKQIILLSDEIIHIDKYQYDSSDVESITIEVDTEKNVINLYYVKLMGKVIINYVDEDGKELKEQEIFTEQVGTPYLIVEPEIEDYILSTVEGETEGTYTEEDIVITYIYETAGVGGDEELVPTGLNDTFIAETMFITSILGLSLSFILKKKINA